MLKNHFKIAFRNLLRNKSQSVILIGGLTIGMAACILLLQYVSFELSFDHFHKNYNNIYRVVNERVQNGAAVQKGTITYPTIGPAMKADFPEIKNATRIAYSSDVMITKDDRIDPIEPGLWVDKHFFEIFDFAILAREGLELLDEPNEVVLSKELADRYFPMAKENYESIIGQELTVDQYPDPFKIVAVCENTPINSSIQFELLFSYASCIRYWGEGADNSRTWSDFYHYVELTPGTSVPNLEAKFPAFSQRHFSEVSDTGNEEIFTLQPLAEAHLYSDDLEYEITQTANGTAVWSMLIIAFFILVIAWINYINLASVRAIERAKEVGVRKVIGATRSQLIQQFFAEALVVNMVSLVLAFGLVQVFAPWFATHFGIATSALSFFANSSMGLYLLISLFTLMAMGVLVSGAYPAWLLSSPHVSSVLKGIFTKNIGGANLRKGLVIFQFTLSIALITATWLVSRQISYMGKKDLGIDIERVMTINSPEMTAWDSTFIDRMTTFKATLVQSPGIISAATSNRSPGQRMGRAFNIRKAGASAGDQSFTSNFLQVDYDYATTYGLELKAGRFFRSTDHSNRFDQIDKIVLNEAAVRMFGFGEPADAIGQELNINEKNWQIIGIVPDFHQQSLHHNIEPIIMTPFYGTYNLLSLKVSGDRLDETIATIQSTYQQFFPGNTFNYEFVDTYFQRLYESDLRFSNILSFFTLLTILIACLGLFGLASYTTFLRTKEIGVRKVLGASSFSIVTLLSKDFMKLVLIALIIAAPIAWFTMQQWLQEFAYRIDIKWWVFVIAGVLAMGIAFMTVSLQSVRAAIANPIDSLRSE